MIKKYILRYFMKKKDRELNPEIFDKLDEAGFLSMNVLKEEPLNLPTRFTKETLDSIIPPIFLAALSYVPDKNLSSLRISLEKISLQIYDSYGDTNYYKRWFSEGRIPTPMRYENSVPRIGMAAKQIEEKNKQIQKTEKSLLAKLGNKKESKNDSVIINNYENKLDNQKDELQRYLEEFIYGLRDIEIGIGGLN